MPELWDEQPSIWLTAWSPGTALRKYWDQEPLSDDELLELVEFGTLRVVGEEWFADPTDEELDEDEATSAHGAPDPDEEAVAGDDCPAGGAEGVEPDELGCWVGPGDDSSDSDC